VRDRTKFAHSARGNGMEADGKGVNVIIDFIGPDYWEKNIDSLAKDGRLVILASMSGMFVHPDT
jgi:NADPH:quinone reductase-like Zn-dependent oxidoreductase